jgi:hypothetical protein
MHQDITKSLLALCSFTAGYGIHVRLSPCAAVYDYIQVRAQQMGFAAGFGCSMVSGNRQLQTSPQQW